MIADHQKTIDQLKDFVVTKVKSAKTPTTLTEDLSKRSRNWVRKCCQLFQRYGEQGDDADLKAWVDITRTTLEHHLGMAKKLNE